MTLKEMLKYDLKRVRGMELRDINEGLFSSNRRQCQRKGDVECEVFKLLPKEVDEAATQEAFHKKVERTQLKVPKKDQREKEAVLAFIA